MVYSPDFFPKYSQTFFIKLKAFFGRALVQKLVDGMCNFLPYDTESWYLPLCIICLFVFCFFNVSVHSCYIFFSVTFPQFLSLALVVKFSSSSSQVFSMNLLFLYVYYY